MTQTHIKLTRIKGAFGATHTEDVIIVAVKKIDFVEPEEVTRHLLVNGHQSADTETVTLSHVTLKGKAGDSNYNSVYTTETVEEIYDLIEGEQEEDDSSMPEWVHDAMMKEQEEQDEYDEMRIHDH